MKSMIPFLTAQPPVATVAQSQSVVSPDFRKPSCTPGRTPIVAGNAFIFGPDQPHQLTNDGSQDIVLYIERITRSANHAIIPTARRERVAERAMGPAPYRWPRKRQTKRPPCYCERYSYNKHCFVNGVQFGPDFGSGQGKSEWSPDWKNFSPLISKR
jgi:hypothetical protein